MLTLIIALLVASAAITFVLIKKGKIADANNNNIPDAIEKPIEVVKEKVAEIKAEVKEVVAKVKEAKKPEPKKKMSAKPVEKKPIVIEKAPTKTPAKKGK